MSIPMYGGAPGAASSGPPSGPNSAGPNSAGPTSVVTGQVSYAWISEAWRLFSLQMGPWIVATLLLAAPLVVFYIVYYVWLLTLILPNGFAPPPTPPVGANGLPSGPLTPGSAGGPGAVQMNAQMMKMFPALAGFGLAYFLWASYLYGGMFRMAVRQVRGLPLEMKDMFRGGPLLGRMLGATLLLILAFYGLEALCLGPLLAMIGLHGSAPAMIAAGVIGGLLLFAAVFFAYGLLLPAFALMADGVPVMAALKRSLAAMKRQAGPAAGFVFVYGLLLYASQLLCGIGMLATVPMLFLLCALAYRDMIGMPDMAPPPAPFYAPPQPGVWPPPPNVLPDAAPPAAPGWGSVPPAEFPPGPAGPPPPESGPR